MSPSATNGNAGEHKVIRLSYDPADAEQSARNLVFALKPHWQHSDGTLTFVPFKDGITNTLLKASLVQPGLSQPEIDHDAILLRAYGNGTDVLIDREREASSHALLASLGLAPPLLARFDNGLLYGFIRGYACTAADLRRPEIWRSTARLLGQWHSAVPIDEDPEPSPTEVSYPQITALLPGKPRINIWTNLQKWIRALPASSKTERTRNEMLQQEFEQITRKFGSTTGLDNGAYVVSHNDLLCGNVIVHPGETSTSSDVSFIDYEYATPAPAAFDIANHFSEWGGLDCEYDVLPTRAERQAFLKEYVVSYHAQLSDGDSTSASAIQADVDTLMREVDEFRGIPGFYWGVWALIQTMISQIDFDYASYAELRLGEYWAWKAESDGTRHAAGQAVPVRERRWAQVA